MMSNIFNQFDPFHSLMNPFLLNLILILLLTSNSIKISTTDSLKTTILSNFQKENKSNMMKNSNKMNNSILLNILASVALFNLSALNLYSWSTTSHLSFNMTLILLLWIPLLLMILSMKKKNFLIHLVPQGTPNLLIPFMFIIELISFFIRPITLTMRLTANMIAGHIMIELNSNLIMNSSMLNIFPSISFLILSIMEMVVACLQAYIITTLISMFISEI